MRLPSFRFVALLTLLLGCLVAAVPVAQSQEASSLGRNVAESGITMRLPAGWVAPPVADDVEGVRRVRVEEKSDSSAFRGARLVVDVVPGLNRLQQERWMRGQLLRGLDASYDIEPVDIDLLGGTIGTAVSFSRGERAGYALYTQLGVFYVVRLDAPKSAWANLQTRVALLDLMRSVSVAP